MSPSITAVCFDLDDTLLEYNQDNEDVWDAMLARTGVARFCSQENAWACANDVEDARDDHHFLTQMFDLAAERYDGPTGSGETLANAYSEVVDHTDVSFRPGAEAALAHARDHGPVGLITNGERRVQETKLDALGIHDRFGTHVYAGDETPPKPAEEPFTRAVADLGTTPGRTLYVGNSLRADIGGAKRAGLHTAWFPQDGAREDAGDHDPDHTFASLTELREIL